MLDAFVTVHIAEVMELSSIFNMEEIFLKVFEFEMDIKLIHSQC